MNTSSLWTFIPLVVFVSCSRVEGDFTMISPSQPIVAASGDDVILPCHLDPPLNVEKFVVEWSRPDLNWVDIVHLYRGGREDLDLKIPSYVNRTEMFTEELKHGNISLKILNVTSGDAGKYRCDIPNLMKNSIVQLVVDPDLKTRTTETPLYSGELQTPDPTKDKVTEVDQTRHHYWILLVLCCSFFLVLLLTVVSGFLMK